MVTVCYVMAKVEFLCVCVSDSCMIPFLSIFTLCMLGRTRRLLHTLPTLKYPRFSILCLYFSSCLAFIYSCEVLGKKALPPNSQSLWVSGGIINVLWDIYKSGEKERSVHLVLFFIISGLKSPVSCCFYSESNVTWKHPGIIDNLQIAEQDCGKSSPDDHVWMASHHPPGGFVNYTPTLVLSEEITHKRLCCLLISG